MYINKYNQQKSLNIEYSNVTDRYNDLQSQYNSLNDRTSTDQNTINILHQQCNDYNTKIQIYQNFNSLLSKFVRLNSSNSETNIFNDLLKDNNINVFIYNIQELLSSFPSFVNLLNNRENHFISINEELNNTIQERELEYQTLQV